MAHVPQLIIDLALILGAAGITTLIFKKLKQPLVLGYILAGLLVGPNFFTVPYYYRSGNNTYMGGNWRYISPLWIRSGIQL